MRAFVAATYDKSQEIENLVDSLTPRSDIRTVRSDQRHVTLLFFAEMSETDSRKMCSLISKLKPDHFTARAIGITGFPKPGRANVAVLLLNSPELEKIHQILSEDSMEKSERKAFKPHITLARSKRKPADVTDFLDRGSGIEIKFNGIVLFRSELTPEGPIYTEICRRQLM